jgi:predicted hydrocarbon binding protein
MIVTKHVSLDDDCIKKMQPYEEKHNGNFSAAIREIIERAGISSIPNNSTTIDNSLFKWMLNEIDDLLVPDAILDEIIDPGLMVSMLKLEEYLNYRFKELVWGIEIALKYDSNTSPSEVFIEIKGTSQKIKFLACIISQFMVKNSLKDAPLEIKSVSYINDFIKIELSKSNNNKSLDSLGRFFGHNNYVIQTMKSRPAFWKVLVNMHLHSNYNMVTVHKNYFEDLLSGKIPLGEITIENLAKRPIQEIPLKEILSLIKEVYETSRIVDTVEIEKDSIILFNNYRNKDAIEKLKKTFVMLLEANGHVYEAKSTSNMIVLTHRPDIGIKINEIVENLKSSNTRLDKELITFMEFLKEVKSLPDIPLSLTSLGRRIGKSLMQVYENENNIKNWDQENFKKAFEIIDSKIHRESEWKVEGKNLTYIIKKCNIASEGDKFDMYLCHTGRETFKGALSYAFGNKAELEIKKLISHKDKFCEVVIKISQME